MADEVALAQIDAFGPLALVTSGDPYKMDQKSQDAAARNPRWVPEISSPTSSSTGAHVGTHAAAEAARVVFRFGLWPAALELWGIAPNDPRAKQWDAAHWRDGQLVMPALAPLPLAAIAAKAHARNGVTGAMAHGFNRWAWSEATLMLFSYEPPAQAMPAFGPGFVNFDGVVAKVYYGHWRRVARRTTRRVVRRRYYY